jgi:hypothetical protein
MQSDYVFNKLGRIGNDITDASQFNIRNNRYSDLVLTNYFSDNVYTSHINFVSEYPGLSHSGPIGIGIGGSSIEDENSILWKTKQERPSEKLQLFVRPFVTVPYLGRGSCNPTLESQLQQGEFVRNRKGVSDADGENIYAPKNYPGATDPNFVEEIALNGWSRGGVDTRTAGEKYSN